MKVRGKSMRSIWLMPDGWSVGTIDQTKLPHVFETVSLTSAALANLIAQVTGPGSPPVIDTTGMNNILDASTAIIAPYSPSPLKMSVSCVSFDANKNMTVKWTALRNGTAPTIVVPTALKVANTQLIYAEVSYGYKPTVGYTITGTLTLSDHMYMAPRISAPTYNSTACT